MEYDKKTFIDQCPCTEEDWECEKGFFRDNKQDGKCVATSKEYEELLKNVVPKDCEGSYKIT